MRAAVLHAYGTPVVGDFADPTPSKDKLVVDVAAAGVNTFDVLLASGTLYLKPTLPCVVGLDGVGRLDDGRRVYFEGTIAPFGAAAERTLVDPTAIVDLPDGIDDAVAAALGNCGLAAWLSLEWRAKLKPGETVLILGGTGTVGLLAIQVAKLLGAGRVIAADRAEERFARAQRVGADACVVLGAPEAAAHLSDAVGAGADVVIDLVWGAPLELALDVTAVGGRIVQIGNLAGAEASLSATTLRSKLLTVMGYANYHVPREDRQSAYRRLTGHAATGEIVVDVSRLPLEEIGSAWDRQRAGAGCKQVLVPGLTEIVEPVAAGSEE